MRRVGQSMNFLKRGVVLAGFVVAGFVLASPAFFLLAFGVPGQCDESSYCAVWFAVCFLSLFPLFTGLLGLVLLFSANYERYKKYLFASCLLPSLLADMLLFLYLK